ncbi:MAG: DinB family protein [Pseudomonadota bacterium]
MSELKLIYSLFDQEVRHTLDFLASLEEKDWQTISHPWDTILFRRLANNVSVAEIIKHIVLLEHHIIGAIESQESGAVLSLEGDETLCEKIQKKRDLVACYQAVHEENLSKITNFKQSDLDKKLTFINQPYTGIGLLWMLTGHHAFHLGQLRSMTFPRTN